MNMLDTVIRIAKRGLDNQTVYPDDYYKDGLLVCGKCGTFRQGYQLFDNPNSTDSEPFKVKVAVKCQCEQEKEELEKKKKEDAEKEAKHKRKVKALYQSSMMQERLLSACFDTFESNSSNEKNLKLCKRYAEHFDKMKEKNQGLLLWGGVGTGKTYSAACIANYLINQEKSVLMVSFTKLLEIAQSNSEELEKVKDKIRKYDLVIFDDLGAERNSQFALEKILDFMETRYESMKPMILTTNITVNAMKEETDIRYARIYDRIFETCYPIQFTGTSWRKKEAFQRYEEMEKFFAL